MNGLTTSTVDDYVDPTAQLAYELSDPTTTDVERDVLIDRYFNESLAKLPVGFDLSKLQPILHQELGQYGVDLAEINRRLEAARFNRYCGSTKEPAQQLVEHQADPVMLFNGQYTHRVEDIRIKGGGIDFVFGRVYKNQTFYHGPLGYSWDHNYNMWLREENPTLLKRSSGELREDRYVLHPIHNYFQPPDGYHDVVVPEGDSFRLVTLDGTTFHYSRIPATLLHRLARVEDRHGNYLALLYNTDGVVSRVEINSPQRFVRFQYDAQKRITSLVDHTGRSWIYEYDDHGDLMRVWLPAESDKRARKFTEYEYSSATYPGRLQHNLLRVRTSDTGVVVENEYGTIQGLLSFNRVTRQRQGNGETLFEYEDILPPADWRYSDEERPTHLTRLYSHDGHVAEHLYNRFGNLIAREERAYGRDGPRRLVSRYRYNADGALLASLSPEGRVVQYWYGRDDFALMHGVAQNAIRDHPQLDPRERLHFGLLLATIKRGRYYNFTVLTRNGSYYGDFFPHAFAEDVSGNDIAVRYTYEPIYGRTLTISDPRVTSNGDPRHPEVLNPAHPNHATYNAQLTRYTYGGPKGHLQRIDYPDCTRPDGSVSKASERYTHYDPRGRLLRTMNAAGEVIRYEYYDAGAGTSEGLLKSEIRDPGGLNLLTAYDYTSIGAVKVKISPKGHRTEFEIDSLGRVQTEINALGHKRRCFYDSDGRTVREERDATDGHGNPLADGPEVRLFSFDPVGNLLEESVGGWNVQSHLRTRHRYDGAGNRVMTILPNGNNVRYAYEARNLLVRATRAPCTRMQSTSRTFYDGDQRKTMQEDGRGFRSHFQYDACGRMVGETDPLGNIRRWTYDKAGNVIVERFFEQQQDGRYYLLSRLSFIYDERGRNIRKTVSAFEVRLPAVDFDNGYLADPGPGRPLTTEFNLDGLDRIEAETDPRGSLTTYDFDGAGRRARKTDAMGNYVVYRYDADGHLEEEEEHGINFDRATGGVVSERVYLVKHEHDALGRRIATTDPLGNRTEWEYDSRNNVTLKRDGLGNAARYLYDIYGRQNQTQAELTATGLGGSPSKLAVTIEDYDANGNRIRITDPVNNTTRYHYDFLDRMIRIDYPDETFQESEYDQVNNLVVYQDSRGVRVRHHYDRLNRRVLSAIDLSRVTPGNEVAGTLAEEFTYDGLGRILSATSDACGVVSTYDSLGRMLTEAFHFSDATGGGLGPLRVARRYDPASNRVELTYPGGRKVRYIYDELNRLRKIENIAEGTHYPGSTLGNSYSVLHHTFDGLLLMKTVYGNRASCSLKWDRARRIIEMRHRDAAGADLLRLQELADAVGNIRLHYDLAATTSTGFRLFYDSLSRLVHIAKLMPVPFNPEIFDAVTVPVATSSLTQADIDAVIGTLALPSGSMSFQFDLAGNREETHGIDAAAGRQQYSVQPGNQYGSVDGTIAQYDGLGCLSQRGQARYTYDHRARAVAVLDGTSEILRCAYDANGRKVAVFRSGSIDHTVYDGSNPLAIYRDGILHAQFVNENAPNSHQQLVEGGHEYWFHKDVVGTTRLLSDQTGGVAATYLLDAYGIPSAALPGTPVHTPLFMGRPYDRATRLYDFRSRTYDPAWGRFLQRDPKGTVDGPNLYTAFANNPYAFLDPLGTESVRQWMLGNSSRNIKEGHAWAAGAWYVGYFFWNAVTFGFVEKNSDSYEQFNGSDYVLMTIADTGRSAAILGVSSATGGLGGRIVHAIGQTGTSATVAYAVGGGVAGSVSGAAALGTEDLIDVVGTGYRGKPHSVGEYVFGATTGGAIGAAAGGLQGAKLAADARNPNVDLAEIGELQASELIGQPRNRGLGPGLQQRLPVPGQRTPTGRQKVYIPDHPVDPVVNAEGQTLAEGTLASRGTVVETKTYVLSELTPATKNMPQALAAAQARGVPLEVVTPQGTNVSSFKSLVASGQVKASPILFPLKDVGPAVGAVAIAAAGRVKPNR